MTVGTGSLESVLISLATLFLNDAGVLQYQCPTSWISFCPAVVSLMTIVSHDLHAFRMNCV